MAGFSVKQASVALFMGLSIVSGAVADDSIPEAQVNTGLLSGELIGDVSMPAGSAMDPKKSILAGNGANAFGKIIAEVRADQVKVMEFYKQNMPTQGWGLISEYQDDDIMLIFQKPTRIAVVEIERGRMTDLTIKISPRN